MASIVFRDITDPELSFALSLVEEFGSEEYKRQLNEQNEDISITTKNKSSVSKLPENLGTFLLPQEFFESLWDAEEQEWKKK